MHEKLPDRTKELTPVETPRQELENLYAVRMESRKMACYELLDELIQMLAATREGEFDFVAEQLAEAIQTATICMKLDEEIHDLNRALNSELEP